MSGTFDFAAVAEKAFGFLLEHGFRLSKSGHQEVVYASNLYEISVFRDRDGIGLTVNTIPPRKSGSVDFRTLIRQFNKSVSDQFPRYDMVSNDEGAERRLELIADTFRRYVDFQSFDSPTLMDELRAEAMKNFVARYPTISTGELQMRFQEMWNHQQYAELLKQFEPLAEHLRPDERSKLEFAKHAIKGVGNA